MRRNPGSETSARNGQDRARHHQRRTDAELLDEDRAEDRADGCRQRDTDLEHAEDAAEQMLVHRALEQREARDVEQRVPDADEAEAHESPAGPRPGSDERDRRTPEYERDAEDAGQPAPSDEADGRQPAGQRSGAERGIQPPDSGLAHAEKLDRRDDEQYVQQSADHRLCVEEQHDQSGVRARV